MLVYKSLSINCPSRSTIHSSKYTKQKTLDINDLQNPVFNFVDKNRGYQQIFLKSAFLYAMWVKIVNNFFKKDLF